MNLDNEFKDFLNNNNELVDFCYKMGEIRYHINDLNSHFDKKEYLRPILSDCVGIEWLRWYNLEKKWHKHLGCYVEY